MTSELKSSDVSLSSIKVFQGIQFDTEACLTNHVQKQNSANSKADMTA